MSQVPANVYVKKTAAGQQAIDISGLEAPTSAAAAASAKPCCDGESEVLSCEDSEVGGVKNICSTLYKYLQSCSDRILSLQASGVISSSGSLNGSQSSLLSGSEVSLAETAGPGDLEKRDSGLGTDSEMNGNEEVKEKGEPNGNSAALKVVNGKSSTESESLLLETAVS